MAVTSSSRVAGVIATVFASALRSSPTFRCLGLHLDSGHEPQHDGYRRSGGPDLETGWQGHRDVALENDFRDVHTLGMFGREPAKITPLPSSGYQLGR